MNSLNQKNSNLFCKIFSKYSLLLFILLATITIIGCGGGSSGTGISDRFDVAVAGRAFKTNGLPETNALVSLEIFDIPEAPEQVAKVFTFVSKAYAQSEGKKVLVSGITDSEGFFLIETQVSSEEELFLVLESPEGRSETSLGLATSDIAGLAVQVTNQNSGELSLDVVQPIANDEVLEEVRETGNPFAEAPEQPQLEENLSSILTSDNEPGDVEGAPTSVDRTTSTPVSPQTSGGTVNVPDTDNGSDNSNDNDVNLPDKIDNNEPTNPLNPEEPTNPLEPEEPTNPLEPEEPTNPLEPEEPVNPLEPEEPTNPSNPSDTDEGNNTEGQDVGRVDDNENSPGNSENSNGNNLEKNPNSDNSNAPGNSDNRNMRK